jgi:hypothetical protein
MTHPEKPPKSPLLPVNFRFPKELRDQLQQAAQANQRSMSGEIIYRLRRSLNQQETSHV